MADSQLTLARRIERKVRLHPLVRGVKNVMRAPFGYAARRRDAALLPNVTLELAVAAIFKDEAPYLEEWLTFHRGVGVEKFYLYNNNSSDNYLDVLAPWLDAKFVTLLHWSKDGDQNAVYADCIQRFQSEARWIAFIDLDEFLFSPVQRDLRGILADYRDLPGVFVYTDKFGSSGHRTRPPGGVLESYLRRAAHTPPKRGKSIVNPRLVRSVPNAHLFKPWGGELLDTSRRPALYTEDDIYPRERLRINHYWSRSIEELAEKVARGRVANTKPRVLADHLAAETELNSVEDRTILLLWAEIQRENSAIAAGPLRI